MPGSKSYTHRLLIAAALSNGPCIIKNPLKSEDTLLSLKALQQMGIIAHEKFDSVEIKGAKGKFQPCNDPIYLANSGTSMRLLTALAAIGQGTYTLTGSKRMQERPIKNLLEGLNQIGVKARAVNNNGCPPVMIQGEKQRGGVIELDCSISSQYLSALLLIGPCTTQGLDVKVSKGPVSKPYLDMTVEIMSQFNIAVNQQGYQSFKVAGNQIYQSGNYQVEPDCSQAGYFWAAGAITGKAVKVLGLSPDSLQGDVRLAEVFRQMGCYVKYDSDGILVKGGDLKGVEVDMADMPDMVPTLAVTAAFASGTTIIKNVAHLKAKESDRLSAVATELGKMGIKVSLMDSGLIIEGGKPKGAIINTYNDHRIAMSFGVAGLKIAGIKIKDENCVAKSFPNFWEVFNSLY